MPFSVTIIGNFVELYFSSIYLTSIRILKVILHKKMGANKSRYPYGFDDNQSLPAVGQFEQTDSINPKSQSGVPISHLLTSDVV